MPCRDITDWLELEIDDKHLVGYRLTKKTCGAPVGTADLLMPFVRETPIDEMLRHGPEQWPEFLPEATDDSEESDTFVFLVAKHWSALRRSLGVFTGLESGDEEAPVSLSTIVMGEPTQVTLAIRVDLLAEEIKACSNCGRCAKKS